MTDETGAGQPPERAGSRPPGVWDRARQGVLPEAPETLAGAPPAPGSVPVTPGSVPPGSVPVTPAPRRRVGRVLAWVAIATASVVLLASGAFYGLFVYYDGNIKRIPALPGGDSASARSIDGEQNFLLVGSDTRDFAGGEAYQGTGKEFTTGQRSDTIILAHLPADGGKVTMVSFPRDSRVQIPSFVDGGGQRRPAHMSKINEAITDGGPPLLIRTVQDVSGMRIDHYAQIDFGGFKQMVDALGGVTVCLTQPAKDRFTGIDLPAGRQTIRGDQALAFVRQRYGLPNGDLDRIGRQQQFLASIVRKVTSTGVLLRPDKLLGFLNAATASVTFDNTLDTGQLRGLALRLADYRPSDVTFATLPVTSINETIDRVSYVALDLPAVRALFSTIEAGDAAPASPAPTATAVPLIVAPPAIRVQVFNGTGRNGLGRTAAQELTKVGFRVMGTPTDRGSDVTQTVVRYGPDKADSAATLSAALPGSKIELDPSLDRTLEVVVGTDFTAAQPVTISAPPSPTPAPSLGSVPVTTAERDVCSV